jgi:hypothetical protein
MPTRASSPWDGLTKFPADPANPNSAMQSFCDLKPISSANGRGWKLSVPLFPASFRKEGTSSLTMGRIFVCTKEAPTALLSGPSAAPVSANLGGRPWCQTRALTGASLNGRECGVLRVLPALHFSTELRCRKVRRSTPPPNRPSLNRI